MDKKTRIEKTIRRKSGMSLAAKTRLQDELKGRQWWTRCWSCKTTVEGTIAELQGTCPNCGASLRERVGGRAMQGTKAIVSESSIQTSDKAPPLQYDANGKVIHAARKS